MYMPFDVLPGSFIHTANDMMCIIQNTVAVVVVVIVVVYIGVVVVVEVYIVALRT